MKTVFKHWCAKLTALGLAAAVSVPAVGFAQDEKVTVKVQPSDFQTTQSVNRLYGRIEYAAWLACESPRGTDEAFRPNDKDRECQRARINDAVGKIGNPRLTDVYHARTAHAPNGYRLK